jgi:hypothetical protein
MATLEKLNALVGKGLGSKTSVILYSYSNIVTAFTNRNRKVFDILVIDCNTQMIPVSGLQKTIDRIWPKPEDGKGSVIERGEVGFSQVPIFFESEYLRTGLIANLAVHESSQALTKEKGITKHNNTRENFEKSFRALLVEAKKHGLTIGMPFMGKENTWNDISHIIETLAEEIGYTKSIRVYKRKQA